MEKRERVMNKQGKIRKKTQISLGGGNIGGLVVWGGALAVAGLVAAFTAKKCIRRDGDKKEEDKGTKGMRFFIQSPSAFSCCKTAGSTQIAETQIGSCDLVSVESLIAEENSTPMDSDGNEISSTDHQEIIVIDEQKTLASSDDCASLESSHKTSDGFTLTMPDGSLMNRAALASEIKNESGEDWQHMQGIEVLEEEGEVDSAKVTTEGNSIEIEEEGLMTKSRQESVTFSDDCAGVESRNKAIDEFTLLELDGQLINKAKSETENESREDWELMQGIEVLKEEGVLHSEKVTTEDSSIRIDEDENFFAKSKLETVTCCDDCAGFQSSYEAIDEFTLPEIDDPPLDEAKSKIENESAEDMQLIQGLEVQKERGVDYEEVTTEQNSIGNDEGDEQDDVIEEYVKEKDKERLGQVRITSTGSINEKVEDDCLPMKRSEATDEDKTVGREEKSTEISSLEKSNKEVEEILDVEKASTENTSFSDSSEENEQEEEEDEEEEEDSSEEYTLQKGEEWSEGTGSTSTESNAETIWPLEVIEGFPMKLNKTTTALAGEIVEEDVRTTENEELGKFSSSIGGADGYQATENLMFLKDKETQETVELSYQTRYSTQWKIWVWSTSAILLLVLLFLAHYRAVLHLNRGASPSCSAEL